MFIKKVTRTYSRSINTKSYGSQVDSWVKVEATYEAECETGDDPLKVSQMIGEQAQKDVAAAVSDVIKKIQEANPKTVPASMQNTAPSAPAAPAAPRAL